MSSLKKFFGTKKSSADSTKEAVRKLEETRDLLMKKSDFLEKKIEECIALAKKYGMKNKRAALKVLAQKKEYEKQLTRMDNTLSIIENQLQTIDNAGMNLEVFKVLKATAGSLRETHKSMKLDDVQNTMDDIMEQRDIAQEISDAISNPSTFGLDIDEDELLAELQGLQEEELKNELLNIDNVPDLPNVPSRDLPNPSTSEEKEQDKQLKDLMAWASAE
ncbi:Charged multivesicular body protein 4Ba [Fasciolopsis buskii]|uniref:Charged multivesicular body protein 4Ba n=1 Tax=Fasciolopsis buskii TaxID=27845 RepID=A0A8E0VRW3_9TREM|nr:Charged multivesicular body protein 4Ba [Fasciolopsis buski]